MQVFQPGSVSETRRPEQSRRKAFQRMFTSNMWGTALKPITELECLCIEKQFPLCTPTLTCPPKYSHTPTCKSQAIHQKPLTVCTMNHSSGVICITCRSPANYYSFQLRNITGGKQSTWPVSIVCHRVYASPIIQRARCCRALRDLNYSNLSAHESVASQNKIREQSSLQLLL